MINYESQQEAILAYHVEIVDFSDCQITCFAPGPHFHESFAPSRCVNRPLGHASICYRENLDNIGNFLVRSIEA